MATRTVTGTWGRGRTAALRFLAVGAGLLVVSAILAPAGASANPATATTGLFAWGLDESGDLGDGGTSNACDCQVSPEAITLAPGVTATAIAAGGDSSLAIGSDGNLYAWGSNSYGQLGDGTTGRGHASPEEITLAPGVTPTAIAEGDTGYYEFSMAIGSDGNLYTWGNNQTGQLGRGGFADGNFVNSDTPGVVTLPPLTPGGAPVTPVAISAGEYSGLVIGSNGGLYALGGDNETTVLSAIQAFDNANGPMTSFGIPYPVPFTLAPGVTPVAISSGQVYDLAIGSDGKLYAWGQNPFGELGDGTTNADYTPEVVTLAPGVTPTAIAASGALLSTAIGSDGMLYTWGNDNGGGLGNGTENTNGLTPEAVSLASGVTPTAISVGGDIDNGAYALAIGSDGNLYTWGYNYYGALGNGTSGSGANVLTPEAVALAAGVTPTAISAGDQFSLAIGASTAPPPTVPGAPTGVTAAAGDGQATISWTAPADNGGSPIAGYAASDGSGDTCIATTTTSCTVTGLTDGQTYTFTVTATNADGTSLPSSPVSVTPEPTYLFVDENPNGTNEVRNYRVNADGTVTLAGTYSTGHPGSDASWLAAGRAGLASAAGYVYALNLGDQTVTVFSVNPTTGALTLVGTTPSLGASVIAVNPAGTVLYAGGSTNEGSLNQLSAYTINSDGSINPTPVSTVPADVDGLTVSPDGTEVAGAYPGTGPAAPSVQIWSTDGTGHLTALSTIDEQCPTDVRFGATSSTLYSAACYQGNITQYDVASGQLTVTATTPASAIPSSSQTLAVGPDGTVYFDTAAGIQGAQASGQQAGPASFTLGPTTPDTTSNAVASVAVSPDGTRLFVASSGTGTIDDYGIGVGHALTLLEQIPIQAGLPTVIAYSPAQ